MAGPTASILLRHELDEQASASVRAVVRGLASDVKADDFWWEGRPFALTLGSTCETELHRYSEDRMCQILGWMPKGLVRFAAMCNEKSDHRLLGKISLRLALALEGLIDFNGALVPPIRGEFAKSFDKHNLGEGGDWRDCEPYFADMVKDLPGKLYSVPYTTVRGSQWVSHICDPPFLEAWLEHEHFHMVK